MEKTKTEKSSKGKAALDKAKKWQGEKRSENEKRVKRKEIKRYRKYRRQRS